MVTSDTHSPAPAWHVRAPAALADGGAHAEVLRREGLWAALRAQVLAFAARGAPSCQWSMDLAPGLPAPQGAFASAICQVLDEMLANVLRHARASDVQVRIRATPADITVLVKDNGRGAPPSAFERADALGVAAMRELCGRYGGWLQIDSQPGQGAQLILSMPLMGLASLGLPVDKRA